MDENTILVLFMFFVFVCAKKRSVCGVILRCVFHKPVVPHVTEDVWRFAKAVFSCGIFPLCRSSLGNMSRSSKSRHASYNRMYDSTKSAVSSRSDVMVQPRRIIGLSTSPIDSLLCTVVLQSA
jgi:hypothetical protein